MTKIRQLCRAEISTKAPKPSSIQYDTPSHTCLRGGQIHQCVSKRCRWVVLVYTWLIGPQDYWLNRCHRYYLTVTQPNQWQRLNDCHQNGTREQTVRNPQREKDVISLFSLLASATYQLKRDVHFWDPHSWRL